MPSRQQSANAFRSQPAPDKHAAAAEGPMPELTAMRRAQQSWANSEWAQRRKILRAFRANMAASAEQIAPLMPATLARNHADTLGAEIMPLLDACKFLELEAEEVLQPQRLGRHRLPLWHYGLHSEVHRDPLGVVLVIAPSNYPLFLAGVQALQSLVAGNGCIWKPAAGCEGVAHAMRNCLLDAGLDPQLLWVTDSSVETARKLLDADVDKVFLTGSVATAQSVLGQLAAKGTPTVMELSGCDAVFVLPGADLTRVAQAIAFGTRLNGSATCMAPRRILVPRAMAQDLESQLTPCLRDIDAVTVNARTCALLDALMEDAQFKGARLALDGRIHGGEGGGRTQPVLLANADETMLAARTDIFAPILALMPFDDLEAALKMYAACPFALSVAIFGPVQPARALSERILAGTVVLNDMIAPTVDPRVPFGGRRASGHGVTRGREGLLEMTAPKVVLTRSGKYRFHYEKTTGDHLEMFAGMIRGVHGEGWRNRGRGWMRAIRAGMRMKKHSAEGRTATGKTGP